MKALLEIKAAQKSVVPAIAFTSFARVTRTIARGMKADARFTEPALEAVREVTEWAFTRWFNDAAHLARHANRATVMPEDLTLARNLRRGAYMPVDAEFLDG